MPAVREPVSEFRDTFGIALNNMLNGADVAADILLKALDKPPKKPRGRPKAKV